MELIIPLIIILAVAAIAYPVIEKLLSLPPVMKQIAYIILGLIVLLALLDAFGIYKFR